MGTTVVIFEEELKIKWFSFPRFLSSNAGEGEDDGVDVDFFIDFLLLAILAGGDDSILPSEGGECSEGELHG